MNSNDESFEMFQLCGVKVIIRKRYTKLSNPCTHMKGEWYIMNPITISFAEWNVLLILPKIIVSRIELRV